MGRTSSSGKRMIMSALVESRTSRRPSVRRAAMTSSPSSRSIARMPPDRGCEEAKCSVCFPDPRVLARELPPFVEGLGAPPVAEVILGRRQLVLGDAPQPLLGGQDALEVGDERQRLLVLLDDLVALELG